MNDFDIVDFITVIFIALPVVVISFFARSYMKAKNEIEQYGEYLSGQLSLERKFILENLKDDSLALKIFIAYALLGLFAFQVYELGDIYVYTIPVVSMFVVFAFYGRSSGIDENDAAFLVMRVLKNISQANRIGNTDKAIQLSKIADFTIAKFQLNKTGDNFTCEKHISFVDTLSGSERTEYIAKNFIAKIYFSLKIMVPILVVVIFTILLKAAF